MHKDSGAFAIQGCGNCIGVELHLALGNDGPVFGPNRDDVALFKLAFAFANACGQQALARVLDRVGSSGIDGECAVHAILDGDPALM